MATTPRRPTRRSTRRRDRKRERHTRQLRSRTRRRLNEIKRRVNRLIRRQSNGCASLFLKWDKADAKLSSSAHGRLLAGLRKLRLHKGWSFVGEAWQGTAGWRFIRSVEDAEASDLKLAA